MAKPLGAEATMLETYASMALQFVIYFIIIRSVVGVISSPYFAWKDERAKYQSTQLKLSSLERDIRYSESVSKHAMMIRSHFMTIFYRSTDPDSKWSDISDTNMDIHLLNALDVVGSDKLRELSKKATASIVALQYRSSKEYEKEGGMNAIEWVEYVESSDLIDRINLECGKIISMCNGHN
ncbi:hypothetical protein [Niveispirillum sp. KHB5.9]|uniref:hypothetical protein n=1 Tax=Niveispirillum sp. KHB5.9 TaxID=3400269 RepID=UPI003A84D094